MADEAMRLRKWRALRRQSRRQVCASCERLFVPNRSDAAFCCPACRQLSYRRRRVTGETALGRPWRAPWRVSEPVGAPNTGAAAPGAPEALRAARNATGKVVDIAAMIA
jgi:predicted RNA-binding Zn-ribbon protein involved in translation (DUF1610 family)